MASLVTQASANASLSAERDSRIESAVTEVRGVVTVQNGRIGKLESWRTQVTAIYGAILVAAPFIFYGLTKLFGGA